MSDIRVPADRVFPILKDSILVDGFHIVIDLEKSHGTTMVDALTGKEYLDCYAYFATLPIGHNHPGMEDEAFRGSLLRAALANPANSDVYSREYAAFVEIFRRVAVPEPFRHLFFIAGGTLAVENGLKAAFDWKAQKNRAKGIEGGADKVLHFVDAFHGRSGYTLSVTNTDPTKTRDFPKFDWPRVSNPKLSFPVDEEAVVRAEAKAVAEIEAAFDKDPHGIAAILIEPIQSEGGDHHFRPEFLQALRRIADRREALLVFDEVQTGMGITGTMWAYQQMGMVPDILAFGKKTQVCGIMVGPRIDEVEKNVFRVSSRINSTWGGNLVDMVRSARYLEIIEKDRLVASTAEVGRVFLDLLHEIQAEVPEIVSNARGRGLLLAFDLPDTATRNAIRQKCWDEGLATLACGPRSLRFRPSLIFSEGDARQAIAILREVLGSGVSSRPAASVATGARI
jgi:L-lysine 6-transaminase